jgi:hypothetical protein
VHFLSFGENAGPRIVTLGIKDQGTGREVLSLHKNGGVKLRPPHTARCEEETFSVKE